MGMATQHNPWLHSIENVPNGWHAIVGFTAISKTGWTPVHEKNVDVAEHETFFHIAAQKIGVALQWPIRTVVECIVEIIKGTVQPRDADFLCPITERQYLARLQVVQIV
jgi:hypothetical protein